MAPGAAYVFAESGIVTVLASAYFMSDMQTAQLHIAVGNGERNAEILQSRVMGRIQWPEK